MSVEPLRFLADENFNGRILRAIERRLPGVDILRTQDTPLGGASDPDLLAWAAEQRRVLLSHDLTTLVGHAYDRVKAGLPMPGVLAVPDRVAIGRVVDDITLLMAAAEWEDLESRVLFLPL